MDIALGADDAVSFAPCGGMADPAAAVTAMYREHALGLTRLALIMIGDRQAAEDIVQGCLLRPASPLGQPARYRQGPALCQVGGPERLPDRVQAHADELGLAQWSRRLPAASLVGGIGGAGHRGAA